MTILEIWRNAPGQAEQIAALTNMPVGMIDDRLFIGESEFAIGDIISIDDLDRKYGVYDGPDA